MQKSVKSCRAFLLLKEKLTYVIEVRIMFYPSEMTDKNLVKILFAVLKDTKLLMKTRVAVTGQGSLSKGIVLQATSETSETLTCTIVYRFLSFVVRRLCQSSLAPGAIP